MWLIWYFILYFFVCVNDLNWYLQNRYCGKVFFTHIYIKYFINQSIQLKLKQRARTSSASKHTNSPAPARSMGHSNKVFTLARPINLCCDPWSHISITKFLFKIPWVTLNTRIQEWHIFVYREYSGHFVN